MSTGVTRRSFFRRISGAFLAVALAKELGAQEPEWKFKSIGGAGGELPHTGQINPEWQNAQYEEIFWFHPDCARAFPFNKGALVPVGPDIESTGRRFNLVNGEYVEVKRS